MTNPWNTIFQRQGRVFELPHEDLLGIVERLKREHIKNVLDLGCGTGRHTVLLAKHGFTVYGLDSAPGGITLTKQWLEAEGLSASLHLQDMATSFPYNDSSIDAVISIQVIHHGTLPTIQNVVREITRVLKTGGFLFITVPSLKNQAANFQEIEPNTFVPLDGREKGLPHHYFTPEELHKVFAQFSIEDIHLDVKRHYCLFGVLNR
jgi:ubiquinone/menaquinone biosynthesis C-methylase UbiE